MKIKILVFPCSINENSGGTSCSPGEMWISDLIYVLRIRLSGKLFGMEQLGVFIDSMVSHCSIVSIRSSNKIKIVSICSKLHAI